MPLTEVETDAIRYCLTGIDRHADQTYPWPGPRLLAALREAPVPGHPDPTARSLFVNPAPTPPHTPVLQDPAEALAAVVAELLPDLVSRFPAADPTIRITAWVYMYSTPFAESRSERRVRIIEAVDLDLTSYVITTRRGRASTIKVTREADRTHAVTPTMENLRALMTATS